ncbi:MAG: prenyltransferase [Planctomycetota bacterium]|nr:MAG: prenyltransferase [Planctomycetota bacterium]REJ89174.1 MAG: prenyltransferase [Planctomycetota bacterium]REK31462.1 MAG: prenyltransferase [Planctomycetota bacterium]REK40692.1 MAG: prenyltransferase [Planctomycetota bacterium]
MTQFNRRQFLIRGSLASTLALGARGLLADDDEGQDERDPEQTAAELVTPRAQTAIARGLEYLASRQAENGSFGTGVYSQNVAVVALGGLAFMSGGSTPGRGPYGEQVDRCLDYILKNTDQSGLISRHQARTHGRMYGHGFATLFLAQAYGMTQRNDVRRKLSEAVRLIVRTQNQEGGWRYEPVPNDADVSVTVCQIMALRAARNAGIHAPKETRDRCVEYIKKCQNNDGGFRYILRGSDSKFPRSAAGVVALQSAGIYEGPEIEKGLAYLMRFLPDPHFGARDGHYFYGHYYAVQAMWHAGGEHWHAWYPAIRDTLIGQQRRDGSWMDSIGQEYGTSMALIVLQMPNNMLPIFQR